MLKSFLIHQQNPQQKKDQPEKKVATESVQSIPNKKDEEMMKAAFAENLPAHI